MDKIGKAFALFLSLITIVSCLTFLTAKFVNAQSTSVPEITILYPANGTFFNVSKGVASFQLKYATNDTLSWIGYSVDGSENGTAYGEWFDFERRLYDAEGNPSVWVYGVFGNDGNHNLTVYANDTAGNWATPQTVTYLVNINSDTIFPPTTSNPGTTQSASLSPTSTLSPENRDAPHLDPMAYLILVSVILAAVILVPILLFSRHQKSVNLSK